MFSRLQIVFLVLPKIFTVQPLPVPIFTLRGAGDERQQLLSLSRVAEGFSESSREHVAP